MSELQLGRVSRNISAVTTSTNSHEHPSRSSGVKHLTPAGQSGDLDDLADTWKSGVQRARSTASSTHVSPSKHHSNNNNLRQSSVPFSRSVSTNNQDRSPRPHIVGINGQVSSQSVSMEGRGSHHHNDGQQHPTIHLPPRVSNHHNLSHSNLSHSSNTVRRPSEHYLDKAVALTGHSGGHGALSTSLYNKVDRLVQENELMTAAEARWDKHTKREEEERVQRKRLEVEEADRNMRAVLDEARTERRKELDRRLKEETERHMRPKDVDNIKLKDLQQSRKELDALLIEDDKATKKHQRAVQRRDWIDQAQSRGRALPTALLEISSDDSDEDIAGCVDFGEYASRKTAKKQAQLAAKEAEKFRGLRLPGDEGKRRLVEHRARETMKANAAATTTNNAGNVTAATNHEDDDDDEAEEGSQMDETNANVNALYKRMIQSIEERRENQRAEEERKRLLHAASDYAGRQYVHMRKDLRKNVLAEAFGDDFDEHAVEEVRFIQERPDYATLISTIANPAGLLQQYRADLYVEETTATNTTTVTGTTPSPTSPDAAELRSPIRSPLPKRLLPPTTTTTSASSSSNQPHVVKPLLEAAARKYVDVLADPFAFLSAPINLKSTKNADDEDTMIRSLEAGNFRALDVSFGTMSPGYAPLSPSNFGTGIKLRRGSDDDGDNNGSNSARSASSPTPRHPEGGGVDASASIAIQSSNPTAVERSAIPFATVPLLKDCLHMNTQLTSLAKSQGVAVRPLIRPMVWKPTAKAHATVASDTTPIEGTTDLATPSPTTITSASQPPHSTIDNTIFNIRKQLLDMPDDGFSSDEDEDDSSSVVVDNHLSLDDMLQYVSLTGLKEWIIKDATENYVPADESEDINNGKDDLLGDVGGGVDEHSEGEDDSSSSSSSDGGDAIRTAEDEVEAAKKRIHEQRLLRNRSMAKNSMYGKAYVDEMIDADRFKASTHFLHDLVIDFQKRLIPEAKRFLVSITTTRMAASLPPPSYNTNRASVMDTSISALFRDSRTSVRSGSLVTSLLAQQRRRKQVVGSSYYGTRPKVLTEGEQAIVDEELLDELRAYHEAKQQQQERVMAAGSGNRRKSLSSIGYPMSANPDATITNNSIQNNNNNGVATSQVAAGSTGDDDGYAASLLKKEVLVRELIFKKAHSYRRRQDLEDNRRAEATSTLALQRTIVRDLKPGARLKAAHGIFPFGSPTDAATLSDDDSNASDDNYYGDTSIFSSSVKQRIGTTIQGAVDEGSVNQPSIGMSIGQSSAWYRDDAPEGENDGMNDVEELLGTNTNWETEEDKAKRLAEREVRRKNKRRQLLMQELEANVHLPDELSTAIEERKAMRRHRMALGQACKEVASAVVQDSSLNNLTNTNNNSHNFPSASTSAMVDQGDESIGEMSCTHSTVNNDSISSAVRGARSLRIRGSIKNVKPTSVSVADMPPTPGTSSSLLSSANTTPSAGGISPLAAHSAAGGGGNTSMVIGGVGSVAAANQSSSASNSILMEESGYVEARDGPITQQDWDYIESIASDDDDGDDSTDCSSPSTTLTTSNSSSSFSSRHLLARKRDLLRLLSVEGQEANMQKRRNRTLALGLGTTATTTSTMGGASSGFGPSSSSVGNFESRRRSFVDQQGIGRVGSFGGSDLSRRMPSLKSLGSASSSSHADTPTNITTTTTSQKDILPPIRSSIGGGNAADTSISTPVTKRPALVTFPVMSSSTAHLQTSTKKEDEGGLLPAPPSPCGSIDGGSDGDIKEARSASPASERSRTPDDSNTISPVPNNNHSSNSTPQLLPTTVAVVDRTTPEYKEGLKRRVQLNKLLIDRMSQRTRKGCVGATSK